MNNRITAVNAVATGGGGAATQLSAKDWAIAIDPRESAAGAPPRPIGVAGGAHYNTLGAWVNRAPVSAQVFEELADSVRLAESADSQLPTATPAARLAHMPDGTTSAIALNSDMTGDLCWLIVAMKLHPDLAVALRIGPTDKHLRVCSAMIEQLVEAGAVHNAILPAGPATTVPGAESQAMRNAEVGRAIFEANTAGHMISAQLGATPNLSEQIVSDLACKEANRVRPALPGVALPNPAAAPKPSPHPYLFRCPFCGDTQQQKSKYRRHRFWNRH
ncbi:hypothetical protein [Corallococcus sp. 4LFB]|uniref:hypothetical protein n=1 Tax=Corallococcus sp. 4LFB TaxID=3383249 RepID=UPI0039752671